MLLSWVAQTLWYLTALSFQTWAEGPRSVSDFWWTAFAGVWWIMRPALWQDCGRLRVHVLQRVATAMRKQALEPCLQCMYAYL